MDLSQQLILVHEIKKIIILDLSLIFFSLPSLCMLVEQIHLKSVLLNIRKQLGQEWGGAL